MSNDPGSGNSTLEVDGAAVLRFEAASFDGLIADDAVALAPLDIVVPIVWRDLAGWQVGSSDNDLIDRLIEGGATPVRHANIYRHRINEAERDRWPRPLPSGLRFAALDRSVEEMAAVSLAAYPSDHPDFETDDLNETASVLKGLIDGSDLGPLLKDASAVVLDGDSMVAVCILNAMPRPGSSSYEPWVSEVFRLPNPAYGGTGAALLDRAIAELARAGETSVGLAVTVGNAAERVYRDLGFELASTSRRVRLPHRDGGKP